MSGSAVEGSTWTRRRANDQYITLDAGETLAKFMVNGAPDDERFEQLVTQLLARASQGGRQVRAFGEMVAVLWANGYMDATMHLEKLWHKLCQLKHSRYFSRLPTLRLCPESGRVDRGDLQDAFARHRFAPGDARFERV